MGEGADTRKLKSMLIMVLMSPVVVLLLVAIYLATSDFMTALPLLGAGIGIGLLNIFVLKFQFAKFDEDDPKSK